MFKVNSQKTRQNDRHGCLTSDVLNSEHHGSTSCPVHGSNFVHKRCDE